MDLEKLDNQLESVLRYWNDDDFPLAYYSQGLLKIDDEAVKRLDQWAEAIRYSIFSFRSTEISNEIFPQYKESYEVRGLPKSIKYGKNLKNNACLGANYEGKKMAIFAETSKRLLFQRGLIYLFKNHFEDFWIEDNRLFNKTPTALLKTAMGEGFKLVREFMPEWDNHRFVQSSLQEILAEIPEEKIRF